MSEPSENRRLLFGGLRTNGLPAFSQPTIKEFLAFARGHRQDRGEFEAALRRLRDATRRFREVVDGVDPCILEQAGWGVVFSKSAKPEIREALQPLLDWRREQVSRRDPRLFRIYEGKKTGYSLHENLLGFLESRGGCDGPVQPEKIPYYLLLVGDPTEIPFEFQYQLDLRHAVGRLSFPTPEEYAAYAANVVAEEKRCQSAPPRAERRASFFCPAHRGEDVEERLLEQLVLPLTEALRERPEKGWTIQTALQKAATRERLLDLLGGSDAPDLLFTACHGLIYDGDAAELRDEQGSLLCYGHHGRADISRYAVGAAALNGHVNLAGRVTFHFGCFSAGVPIWDGYEKMPDGSPKLYSPHPFTTGLSRRLLGKPGTGALAVIGHVDRAWTYSFVSRNEKPRLSTFEECLRRLLRGEPVGRALETFNLRYAALSAEWLRLREREQLEAWAKPEPDEMVDTFCTWLDARSFVVLGDPAVRLPVATQGGAA